MTDIYNQKIYNLVKKEIVGVKWSNCPYDIEQSFVQLVLRYYPTTPIEQIKHDVNHAIADIIGDGCELETI